MTHFRIALIILLVIVAGRVEAYPATSSSPWGCGPAVNNVCGCGGGMPGGGISHTSAAAACGDPLWLSSGNTGGRDTFDRAEGNLCYWRFSSEGAGGGIATHTVCQGPAVNSCPNGGTLSGATCVCGSGETDTGTACTTPSCPAGQHLVGGVCVSICPAAGRAWNPLDSGDPSLAELTYPSGQTTVCADVAFVGESGPVTDKCRVIPTGSIIVCADIGGGGGVICGSETGRYTGARCTAATDLPAETTNTCDSGDLWCRNPTGGACASGYMGASFNGEALCVKIGEPVNAVSQPDSAIAPPVPGHADSPPSHSDPSNQTGESEDPDDRTVVGVGSGATTGNGTGGNGEGIVVCGLPDTPPCKIDETGTPTGEGADTDARAEINTEAGKLTTKLDQIIAGDGAPDRSWGFSISFPSTCNPMSIGTARWGFYTLDFCQWQSVAHDLMSLVWIGATIFACLGMVFRAISAG